MDLGYLAHTCRMHPFRILILLIAITLRLPVADVAGRAEFHRAGMSPGGDYIAVERSADGGRKLVANVGADKLGTSAVPHLAP